MKKTALTLTLMLALLFSALAGTHFVNSGKSNPFPTYPDISIESPANKTYTSNSLFLNVTIVTQWDGLYFTSTRRLVSYCIDEKESIPITEATYWFDSEKQASIFSGSAFLANLTEGTHNLRVNAEYHYDNGKQVFVSSSNVNFTFDPAYTPPPSPSPSPSSAPTPSPPPTPSSTSSEEPTITPEPEQTEPSLTTIVAAASVITAVVVGAGLLVYFKKRQKGSEDNG